jgi:hypothetical protein
MNLVSPYASLGPHWLRGTLHVHSTASDGKQPPDETLRDYESRGYDVAALTDHNVFAQPPAGVCKRIVCLPGCEYRAYKGGPELGIIGARGTAPTDINQEDAVAAVRALDAFVVYNHPNWDFEHWPAHRMITLRTADALEVYNAVIEGLAGSAEASDKWDILLSCGYRLWGIATDDAHHAPHRGRAWVMINADRNERSVLAALKAGRFYASTGVCIDDIALHNGVLSVRTNPRYRVRFIVERGRIRAELPGDQADYTVAADDVYVRAEVHGDAGAKAWTNPIFVESDESRARVAAFYTWYHRI